MKIGLINLYVDTNYGGNLQRYALYQALTKMGHDVYFIQRRFTIKMPRFPRSILVYLKRLFLLLLNKNEVVFFEYKTKKEYDIQLKETYRFIDKYINCYREIFYNDNDLAKLNDEDFDAIIVGSDQVWRFNEKYYTYFLDFIHNKKIKKIAYAASFGNKGIGYDIKHIKECGKLISLFTAISLREKCGQDLFDQFRWKFPKQVDVVLDPSLLLNVDDYKSLMTTNKRGKYIFCYVLDSDAETSNFIIKTTNLLNANCEIIDSLFPNIKYNTFDNPKILPSIEQWLNLVYYADFVITDSYHGTMFSILFNKPFLTIINPSRGAERYYPLLDDLGLTNHLVNKSDLSLVEINEFYNVNWININKKLEIKREKSLNFLRLTLC